MSRYVLTPKFSKRLRKKPPEMQGAVLECIKRLENPRHPGLNAHLVDRQRRIWEAYIDGSNRVTFRYRDDGAMEFLNHCNHDMLRAY